MFIKIGGIIFNTRKIVVIGPDAHSEGISTLIETTDGITRLNLPFDEVEAVLAETIGVYPQKEVEKVVDRGSVVD